MLLHISKDTITLQTKAIHNKDYSVVKTFKAGLFGVSPSVLRRDDDIIDFFANFASALKKRDNEDGY
jgi:hypothetical protein